MTNRQPNRSAVAGRPLVDESRMTTERADRALGRPEDDPLGADVGRERPVPVAEPRLRGDAEPCAIGGGDPGRVDHRDLEAGQPERAADRVESAAARAARSGGVHSAARQVVLDEERRGGRADEARRGEAPADDVEPSGRRRSPGTGRREGGTSRHGAAPRRPPGRPRRAHSRRSPPPRSSMRLDRRPAEPGRRGAFGVRDVDELEVGVAEPGQAVRRARARGGRPRRRRRSRADPGGGRPRRRGPGAAMTRWSMPRSTGSQAPADPGPRSQAMTCSASRSDGKTG